MIASFVHPDSVGVVVVAAVEAGVARFFLQHLHEAAQLHAQKYLRLPNMK